MLQFSNYVPSPQTRYDLAYNFIYLVAFNTALNVAFLAFTIVKKVYSACRRFFVRRKAKLNRQRHVADETSQVEKNPVADSKTNVLRDAVDGKSVDELLVEG